MSVMVESSDDSFSCKESKLIYKDEYIGKGYQCPNPVCFHHYSEMVLLTDT